MAKVRTSVIFADGTAVRVELADTNEARARGLMFHQPLGPNEGMLFVFDAPGRYGFWMKNVPLPLDIIWIDQRQRVVWIVESAPPCHGEPCPAYVPQTVASYVVEVPGGFAARHGVRVGDVVEIDRDS
jgi:hypothetical protein